ncbi:MAG: hypothetical protein IPK59_02900 [Rhodospirillaceae bacterium]|nr:hypothetical protein [Rhodospirillaceae bacterium]
MPWTTLKPNCLGSLAEALPYYRTLGCRKMAEGYETMLAKGGGTIPQKNQLDLAGFVAAIPHLALVAVTKARFVHLPSSW